MGRFWQTDQHGYLLNDCQRTHLQPPFAAVLQEIIAAYTHHIEADLHSLYIVGAIPRGLAIPGKTPIEVIGVLEYSVDPELVMQDWLPLTANQLAANHTSVTTVHLDLLPQGYLFRNPEEFSPGAFHLVTQALCVWGSDLMPELPRYNLLHRPTRLAIANDHIVNVLPDIQEAIAEIETTPTPAHIAKWCQRVCQHLILTGFSLVMEEIKAYTCDVDIATEQFCRYYPVQAAAMQQVHQWTQQPTQEAKPLLTFLETFGDWLIERCEDWLAQHNPEQDEYFIFDEDQIE